MIGRSLGVYRITQHIGRGGMADVFLAEDQSIGRQVAIKLLPAEFLRDEQFIKRFEREVKIIASLQHASILQVYAYGQEGGQPYIVMGYLPGGSLAEEIARSPGGMSLERISYLLERICPALDYAHKRGVIHRDFKPSNVLLDEEGHPYIADFGIAKAAAETAALTGSGIIGTPNYMAPEMGDRDGLSPLIDVYALGVSLYQMLTGEVPFQAPTPMGVLMAHATKPIPDPREVRPSLAEAVVAVVRRALAKQPDQRFQSAGALAQAFRAAIQAPGSSASDATQIDVDREETVAEIGTELPGTAYSSSQAPVPLRAHQVSTEIDMSWESTAPGSAEAASIRTGPSPAARPAPAKPARRKAATPLALIGGLGVVALLVGGGLLLTGVIDLGGPELLTIPAMSDSTLHVVLAEDITTTNAWEAYANGNYADLRALPPRISAMTLSEGSLLPIPWLAAAEPARPQQEGSIWYADVALRQDVLWSNGTPVTAYDWQYTAEVVRDFELYSAWNAGYPFEVLDRVEAKSDFEARIWYHARPTIEQHDFGVLQGAIMPMHFWASEIESKNISGGVEAKREALFSIDGFNEPVAGPWILADWSPGEYVLLEANPGYALRGTVYREYDNFTIEALTEEGRLWTVYGKASGAISHEYASGPFYPALMFHAVPDEEAAAAMLSSGEAALAIYGDRGFSSGVAASLNTSGGLVRVDYEFNNMRYLGFNARRAPMNDQAFRQAVATIIDNDSASAHLLEGFGVKPLNSLVAPADVFWFNPDISRWGFEQGRSMDSEQRAALASTLLADAGYTRDGSGRLQGPDGALISDLVLYVPDNEESRVIYAEYVTEALAQLGISIDLRRVPFAEIVSTVIEGQDFDMWILGWSLDTWW